MMITYLNNLIWENPYEKKNIFTKYSFKTLQLMYVLVRDIMSGQISLRAMSLVYTTLLSFVPLLALSFSVLKAFGVHNQIEPFLKNLLLPLGEKGAELSGNIIMFVENMKVGVLGAIGLGVLIYTVISLIHKIEGAFNHIWKVKHSRPLAQRFSGYLSVIIISPVLAVSAIGITNAVAEGSIIQSLMGIDAIGSTFSFFGALVPTILTGLIFMMIYILMPNTQVKVIPGLIAGMATAVVWEAASQIFSIFNTSGNNYEAIYSGFAIIIVFMIWLYLNWLIVLLGASLSYYLQHPSKIKQDTEEDIHPNLFNQLSHCMHVVEALQNAQEQTKPVKTNKAYIAKQTPLSTPQVDDTLILLESAGYIVKGENGIVALRQNKESLTYASLWQLLNKKLDNKNLHPDVKKHYKAIEKSI